MDWISTACGDKWNSDEILKMCQDRNEHLLIANVSVRHGTYIGSDIYRRRRGQVRYRSTGSQRVCLT